jgi:hypothetical protein
MRYALRILAFAVVSVATLKVSIPLGVMAQPADTQVGRKPVIVELFTSEGCSSCPPADALVWKLESQQPIPDADVIVLEEHITYWDDTNAWVDPFSSEQWTLRQQDYVTKLKASASYTPQMVVDGQSQFVGSNAPQATQAIEAAAHLPTAAVEIVPEASTANGAEKFNVTIGSLEGNTPGDTAEVWLAVTESGLHTPVSRGENAGHDWHHGSIVRTFYKIGVANEGTTPSSFVQDSTVKIDRKWNRANLRIVVFVQEKKSLRILGAGSLLVADAK